MLYARILVFCCHAHSIAAQVPQKGAWGKEKAVGVCIFFVSSSKQGSSVLPSLEQ